MRLILIVLSFALLGCTSERKVTARESLMKQIELRDAMCNCAKGDVNCMVKVANDRDQWMRQPGDDRFAAESALLEKELRPVADAYLVCMITATSS